MSLSVGIGGPLRSNPVSTLRSDAIRYARNYVWPTGDKIHRVKFIFDYVRNLSQNGQIIVGPSALPPTKRERSSLARNLSSYVRNHLPEYAKRYSGAGLSVPGFWQDDPQWSTFGNHVTI
jgi:hypothetical protein